MQKKYTVLLLLGVSFIIALILYRVYALTHHRSSENVEGKFCGGIAGNLPENQCPQGYYCKLDGNYPDAGGRCVKR